MVQSLKGQGDLVLGGVMVGDERGIVAEAARLGGSGPRTVTEGDWIALHFSYGKNEEIKS